MLANLAESIQMSDADQYKKIYQRIERLAGLDPTPRLLQEINSLGLSDFGQRLTRLVELGYQPTDHEVWKDMMVLSALIQQAQNMNL